MNFNQTVLCYVFVGCIVSSYITKSTLDDILAKDAAAGYHDKGLQIGHERYILCLYLLHFTMIFFWAPIVVIIPFKAILKGREKDDV